MQKTRGYTRYENKDMACRVVGVLRCLAGPLIESSYAVAKLLAKECACLQTLLQCFSVRQNVISDM